jgi:uncharacterized protein YjbJ (UPF0337 family)
MAAVGQVMVAEGVLNRIPTQRECLFTQWALFLSPESANQIRSSAFPSRLQQKRERTMDENRIEGTARNLGGKVQEGLGRVTGDAKTQAEGRVNQVRGSAQDLYGQARDSASQIAGEAAVRARQTASSFENALRNTIETQPYTAVFIALGIGWLLGRTHRPL